MRRTRLLLGLVLLVPGTALADQVELPTSDAAQLAATTILKQLPGFRPDRLLPSNVPGPGVNSSATPTTAPPTTSSNSTTPPASPSLLEA